MILTYSGKRLFKIYVDNPDIYHVPKIWKLVDRIGELDCLVGIPHIFCFFACLGPAPNLKVFQLRESTGLQQLVPPKIFGGYFPSLQQLCLETWVAWPTGLFKNLRSFEVGVDPEHDLSPTDVLDVLWESPLLENLHLVSSYWPPDDEPLPIALPSLKNCK